MTTTKPIAAGERFGLLTASRDRIGAERRIPCVCDCGTETTPLVSNLRQGKSRSCGCQQARGATHPRWEGGKNSHPLTSTYRNMIDRCTNPKNMRFNDYGGRGITVCDRWRDDFWAFVADVGDKPVGKSLDRIDNDGNYEPDNVRWATPHEQNVNRRHCQTCTCRGGEAS